MAEVILKICKECAEKITKDNKNGNPMVDLVKLQVALYYNTFVVVPAEQCHVACHPKKKLVMSRNPLPSSEPVAKRNPHE